MSLDLNVSWRAAGFNLVLSVYVFFSLKAVGPIDCHYMTDRLQRFELKIFYWRNKVTYILDALRVTDKHHIIIFGWTIPLRIIIKPWLATVSVHWALISVLSISVCWYHLRSFSVNGPPLLSSPVPTMPCVPARPEPVTRRTHLLIISIKLTEPVWSHRRSVWALALMPR